LLTSVSRDVLVHITALPSAEQAWKHIKTSFASQPRAWVINTHMALTTSQKGTSTVAEYIAKMKTLADEMASTRKKLNDEELCSYILVGLDAEYNSLGSSIAARSDPITLGELYSQLLSFENSLELQKDGQSMSLVNNASRGQGTFCRGVVVAALAVVGVTAEETAPTSQGKTSHRVSYVAEQIILCSSATRDLIQITWGKRRAKIQQTRMEYIQIGM
jgi:hypothetical protein